MQVFFYILAVLSVLGALGLVTLRNPVYCALSLVGTLIFVAGIFVLLNHEFIAAIQVLIYAGAIMVLFLFVIMLLNLRTTGPFRLQWDAAKVVGALVSLGILAQMVGVFNSPAARLGPRGPYSPERIASEGSVELVGQILFTDYVLPFEVISVLLMVAVIGAVILAKRRAPQPPEEGPGE